MRRRITQIRLERRENFNRIRWPFFKEFRVYSRRKAFKNL